MKKKTLVSICSIALLAGVVSVSMISQVNGQTGEVKLHTQEEIKELKNSVGKISTKHGEFVRVEKAADVSEDEVARSKDSINEKTKVLILDYGTFQKQ